MPRKVELYLAIYLPKWLSQLESLPLATREKEKQAKMSCLELAVCFLLGKI